VPKRFHVLHDEDFRLQAAQQADVFPEKLVPAVVHLALPRGRESLIGRGTVEDVESPGLYPRDPQAFLDRKPGDVAVPDRDTGDEGLDGLVVSLDRQQLAVSRHAVPVRRAAATGDKGDHGRRVGLPGLKMLLPASPQVHRVVF
jgi:hypothetical protein